MKRFTLPVAKFPRLLQLARAALLTVCAKVFDDAAREADERIVKKNRGDGGA